MVEIKIDTTKASKEDIKRAIEFLKKYLEEPETSNCFDGEVPLGAMDIFSQDETLSEKKELKKEEDENLDIKPIFY